MECLRRKRRYGGVLPRRGVGASGEVGKECAELVGGFLQCRAYHGAKHHGYVHVAEWNVYGVSGAMDYRVFSREERLPAGYPFLATTHTGYVVGGFLQCRAYHGAKHHGYVHVDGAFHLGAFGIDGPRQTTPYALCATANTTFSRSVVTPWPEKRPGKATG